MAPIKSVQASIPHLCRDQLYELEKPYSCDFPTDGIEGAKASNHILESTSVEIHDGRDRNFDLDTNGFTFISQETTFTRDELRDPNIVSERYLPYLADLLHKRYPYYKQVLGINYQVRKRSPVFPQKIGTSIPFEQPANLPHCDFTHAGAVEFLKRLYSDKKEVLENTSFDMLGVWHVLQGPNNDWPLALLDAKSISAVDCRENDSLHYDSVGENLLLHASEAHQWWYLSNQNVDDLFIIRNSSSDINVPFAFHVAFDTGNKNLPPRESIELRFVAFRE